MKISGPFNDSGIKVLITGGSGLLALNWVVCMRDRMEVILGFHQRKINLQNIQGCDVDLDNVDSIERILEKIRPDYIIHAAGLTSVEECELNPVLAKHVNTDLAVNVAKVSNILKIPLVHISTDHLFSGKEAMVDESHPVNPLNIYGRTKADAELGVMAENSDALVIRTNFYGWGPSYRSSFSDHIIKELRSMKEITLFQDVYYTPILAERLIETVHELLRLKERGLFHVVSDEPISKYTFGIKLAERFGLNTNLIKPGVFNDNFNLVRRPLNMSLSNKKVASILGKKLGSVDSHLTKLYEQELQESFIEIQSL